MNKQEQEVYVQKIRTEYTEKEYGKIDELQALDREVKRPAKTLAYAVGTIGTLILGSGMCLAMGVIGKKKAPGIVIGCAGLGMLVGNYPLYKAVLKSRKAEYAERILALSNSITEGCTAETDEEIFAEQ